METSKKWFWILFDVLVAVAVVVLLAGVLPFFSKWGNSLPPARTISVSAQGMTTATPDLAEISFSVVAEGSDPTTLSNNSNTKMAAVVAFVSSEGVASSDIATTAYDLEPTYSQVSVNDLYAPAMPVPTTPTITGYTLTQTVEVKIRDLTKVASVLGGLAPLGVNQVSGVDFTFSNPDAVTAIARADALTLAKAKASAMAAAAGMSLGNVITMNESSYFPGPVAYASVGAMAVAASAPVAPTINPGTQDITDTVNVTYELK